MSGNPAVRVTDAPGYEDFDGELLYECEPDVGKSIVGFTADGKQEVAVVPSGSVHKITDTDRLAELRKLFSRGWYCEPFRDSLGSEQPCSPRDPHFGNHGCSYRWTAVPLTEGEARRLGLTEEGTT